MLDAPKQNWALYESRCRATDEARIRAMTTDERFALYASMFNLIWRDRDKRPGDWERLDQWRWQQKLALRRRMVATYKKLDELYRDRAAGNRVD
jgi:hypothetical protein